MRSKIAAFFALAALVAGCGGDIEPGRTKEPAVVVRGVTLQQVSAEPVARGESFVGTVASPDRGVLGARIDGRVAELPAAEGEEVAAGQVLVVLADHQAAERLAEARGAVAEAEGARGAARAGLALAEETHRRYLQLKAGEAVTPQEMDRVTAELEQARQQVRRAEAGLERTRAAAAAARTAASWTQVTAPYPARVVRHQVDVGSTVMPGTPLVVLDREGAWEVRATVPESRIGRLAVGQQLAVTLPARDLELTGTVREILPAADPQSRSFEVKVALPPASGLAAGLFARVHGPAAAAQVLLVPAAAVVERGQLHGVYVHEKDRLRFRLVRTGRRTEGRVEILSGLEDGATIVVEGVDRAKDGARVEG